MIKELTPDNSIILSNSCDFINRYIPFYTRRYIFSGEYTGEGNCENRIVTVCGSDTRLNFYKCDLRNNLTSELFDYPTEEVFKKVHQEMNFDFMLINKQEKISINLSQIKILKKVGETTQYILYRYEQNDSLT